MTIEDIQKSTEFQVFDRKSARIDAKALAITIIAFANADGGRIAIGVEDDGTLTGVDRMLTLSTSVATRHISSKLGSVLAAPSVP